MNGYFQLEVKSRGIYLKLFPPTDGGKACSMEDITTYLGYHNITGYNIVEIKRFVDRKAPGELFLSAKQLPVSGEQVMITVSQDKMTATAKFYPPFVGGKSIDERGIDAALEAQGIVVGIKRDVIEYLLKKREYCESYVIAEGIESEPGEDASIQYFFDTELRAKPQLNEDGSVDFHKLNSISHIKKGDILATLTPEKKGTPGANLLGTPIPPREGKKKKLSFGKNISYTEDRLSIISNVDGHVCLVDEQVFVSDTYEVPGDVDTGTGDIEYNGNIEVKGNVRSGFMLKADGNIIVHGVVEGAILIAGGDIVLSCGIQGMSKGSLTAGGNVVSKFLENATVKAGGNVTAEAILHSNVSAKEMVMVTGKKGFITGGKVSALNCVEAKIIGSTMGSETTISVGIDPELKEKAQQNQIEMTKINKELTRIEPVVKKMTILMSAKEKLSPEKLQQAKLLVSQYRAYKQQYEKLEEEVMEIMENEELEEDAKVRVRGKIYPGVKIVISDCMYRVKDVAQYCQFKRQGVDVKMSGL